MSSKKADFRKSKEWRDFREVKRKDQDGKCFVTGKKLLKGANLHHLDMSEENYSDLSKKENFIFVNKSIHEVIHTLYRYYRKDEAVLDRIKNILDRMKELNEK